MFSYVLRKSKLCLFVESTESFGKWSSCLQSKVYLQRTNPLNKHRQKPWVSKICQSQLTHGVRFGKVPFSFHFFYGFKGSFPDKAADGRSEDTITLLWKSLDFVWDVSLDVWLTQWVGFQVRNQSVTSCRWFIHSKLFRCTKCSVGLVFHAAAKRGIPQVTSFCCFFLCGGKWATMCSVLNIPLVWSKYRDNPWYCRICLVKYHVFNRWTRLACTDIQALPGRVHFHCQKLHVLPKKIEDGTWKKTAGNGQDSIILQNPSCLKGLQVSISILWG